MIEKVFFEEHLLAIIVKSTFKKDGIEFFTPGDFSQQLGYMSRKKGFEISPHIHNIVERKVFLTQEVLFIKSGKVEIHFYNNYKKYLQSKIIESGDIVLLASGGHGFTMLEDSEIFEVKQGPYCGEIDKERF